VRHSAKILGALVASVAVAPAASAAIVEETATAALFGKTCVEGGLQFEAREAAIAADPEWKPLPGNMIDVPAFGITKSQSPNFDYTKPLSEKTWQRSFEGRTVYAVLARFDPKRRYPSLCALVVPNVENALPHWDAFRGVAQAAGLKAKSVDLVHYVEYSGKPQGTPVRMDMFSRSFVLGQGEKTLHMTAAFQP
jgi:hypothetical protein